MVEKQVPESGQPRTGRMVVVLVTAISAVALAAALFVVVKSLHRVQPEQLPPALEPATPDTAFVMFRAKTRRQLSTLSFRCKLKRRQLGDSIAPSQDSMSQDCDTAIAAARNRIAAFDTVSPSGRKAAADSITAIYDRAKLAVRVFTRSGSAGDTISDDSLDKELHNLISE